MLPPGVAGDGGKPLPKVAVIVPSTDKVDANFAMALAASQFVMGRLGFTFHLFNMKGSSIAKNRDNGMEAAKHYGCEWAIQLDSDLTFPPQAIVELLGRAIINDVDIIGGSYVRRAAPHDNLAVPLGGATVPNAQGVIEVQSLPTGFLMVRVACLEKMKRPYFRFVAIEEGTPVPEEYQGVVPDDGKPKTVGEDVYFCIAARKRYGLKVWLDVDISADLVHWGENGYRLKIHSEPQEAASERYERVELPGATA